MTQYQDIAIVTEELRDIARNMNISIITATQPPPPPGRSRPPERDGDDFIFIDYIGLIRP